MGWKVYGERLETADLTGTRVNQSYQPNKNLVIRGCRIWIIVNNNPPFTDLNMKIYSNDNGDPGKLLHTSTNVQTKAALITLANGVIETFFDFADVPMHSNDTYRFVLNGTGYTGTDSSHLAWRRGWPNPVYRPSGFGFSDLVTAPLTLYTIGAEL